MDISEILQAGSDILDDVREAVDTNNYVGLGNSIRDRVRQVQEGQSTSRNQATPGSFAYQSKARRPQSTSGNQATPGTFAYRSKYRDNAPYMGGIPNQSGNSGAMNDTVNAQNGMAYRNYAAGRSPVQRPATNFAVTKVTKTNGTVETAFGAIGTAVCGLGTISSFVSLIARAAGTAQGSVVGAIVLTVLLGLCTAGSIFFFLRGRNQNALVDRYYQLGGLLGTAEYFSISDIAAKIGQTEKKLLKELKQMIKLGFLPQARLDRTETTLMLTDRAYGMYQQAEEDRKKREAEQKEAKEKADSELASIEDEEIREILKSGTAYLKHVREINDLIPDTDEMSDKLYHLEEIMHRIFDQVKKQPRSAAGLRRFMGYYLPTTDKLLGAYVELDSQPNVGDNITNTKNEIKDAMDTINDAFDKLLDSLFEDVAWDISSDISVMKTMMEQDGLTEKEKEKEPVPVNIEN